MADNTMTPEEIMDQGTIQQQREKWRAVRETRDAFLDRKPIFNNLSVLAGQLREYALSVTELENQLKLLNAQKKAVADITQAARELNSLKADAQVLAQKRTAVQARINTLGAVKKAYIDETAALKRPTQPTRGLSDIFASASENYRLALKAGQLWKVREDLSPACTNSGCAIDPREPGFIYLTRVTDYGGKPPVGWTINSNNPLPSMWEWQVKPEEGNSQNLLAPWVGVAAEHVPEPRDNRLKWARLTGDYSYFYGGHPNADLNEFTRREMAFWVRARGAHFRAQHKKVDSIPYQAVLYTVSAVLIIIIVTSPAGIALAGTAAALGTTGAMTSLSATAALAGTGAVMAAVDAAIIIGVTSALQDTINRPGVEIFTIRKALHEADKLVFRRIYQPIIKNAVKAIVDTVGFLDTYVPGWAILIDILAPIIPIFPLIGAIFAAVANLAGAAVYTVFLAGANILNATIGIAVPAAGAPLLKLGEIATSILVNVGQSALNVSKTIGVKSTDLLSFQATAAKAVTTMIRTKGDLVAKIQATSIEVGQSVVLAVALIGTAGVIGSIAGAAISAGATGGIGAGGAAPAVAGVVGGSSTSILSLGNLGVVGAGSPFADLTADVVLAGLIPIIKSSAEAAFILIQADKAASIARSAARKLKSKALIEAGKLDAEARALEAEISKIQWWRSQLTVQRRARLAAEQAAAAAEAARSRISQATGLPDTALALGAAALAIVVGVELADL